MGRLLITVGRLVIENVAVFFLATFLIFWIINQAPGNPIDIWHPEPDLSQVERQELIRELGLDAPLPQRYANLLWRTVRLRLGQFEGIDIAHQVGHGIWVTLELTLGAILMSLLLAVPVGVAAGLGRGGAVGGILGGALYVLSLLPLFVLCYGVQLVFLRQFHVLPLPNAVEGLGALWRTVTALIIITVLGLGDGSATEILRYVSTEVGQINRSGFIQAARANGASLLRHLGRNVLVPIVTVVNQRALYYLGGAVVVEAIFQLNGIGWLTWQAIDNRNYELLFAVSVVSVIAVCTINLLNGLLIGIIDPRVRGAAG